jgi:hypothetical protein
VGHLVRGGATTFGVYVQKADLGPPSSERVRIIDTRGDRGIRSCRTLRNRWCIPSHVRGHAGRRLLFLAARVHGRTQMVSKGTPAP